MRGFDGCRAHFVVCAALRLHLDGRQEFWPSFANVGLLTPTFDRQRWRPLNVHTSSIKFNKIRNLNFCPISSSAPLCTRMPRRLTSALGALAVLGQAPTANSFDGSACPIYDSYGCCSSAGYFWCGSSGRCTHGECEWTPRIGPVANPNPHPAERLRRVRIRAQRGGHVHLPGAVDGPCLRSEPIAHHDGQPRPQDRRFELSA